MPTTVFSPYCHTMALSLCRTSMIRSLPWSVISMFPPGRNVFWTGVLSWLNPNPVTPKVPYCQMMLPLWSTRRTLLSTQPVLQFVVAPGGYPCAGHQCEAPDTLSVVRSDDCIGRGISWTVSELPDDTAVWGYFDDSVVELVGDENVAILVKLGIGGYSLCWAGRMLYAATEDTARTI